MGTIMINVIDVGKMLCKWNFKKKNNNSNFKFIYFDLKKK